MTEPQEFKNVNEASWVYDTAVIAKDNPLQQPLVFQNFQQLAALEDGVPFFDARQIGEVGSSYTNVEDKGGMAYPFSLESLGIRFVYPDPHAGADAINMNAAAKMFQMVLPEHCYFTLQLREDIRIKAKPFMLPPGYGPQGMAYVNLAAPSNNSNSVISSGWPTMGNRFKQVTGALQIPRNCPVRGRLHFSEYAKALLTQMIVPLELEFEVGVPFTNAAMIEVTMRGVRGVQQRGELHF